MIDNVSALKLLRHRVNEKKPLGLYDIGVIETAAEEIEKLRKSHAALDARLHEERQ